MNTTKQSGVTLIELMIVVVVVAILASIAYPSYRRQVMRASRAEAKVALEQASQGLERCFTRNHSYVGCALATSNPTVKYTLSFLDAPTAAEPTEYVLRAVPQGGQADDRCGTLTLDQAGRRGQDEDATPAECW